jgi:hypothetical protein
VAREIEAMLETALDQDYAAAVDWYDRLTPLERGDLAVWVCNREPASKATAKIIEQSQFLAAIGFMEVSRRWIERNERPAR